MQKTILQVPLTQDLKLNAEKVAREQGFSSLQEVVRVFLTKLATNKVEVTLENVYLTDANEKRYTKMTKDFEADNNTHTAQNVDDLISQLNEN